MGRVGLDSARSSVTAAPQKEHDMTSLRRNVRPRVALPVVLLGLMAIMVASVGLAAPPTAAVTLSFRTRVYPTVRAVTAGDATAYEVTLTGTRLRSRIALTAMGLPPGATGEFLSTSSSLRRILLVRTTATTPSGDYTVIVEATAGAIVWRASLRLTVSAPPVAAIPVTSPTPTTAPPATAPPATAPPATSLPSTTPIATVAPSPTAPTTTKPASGLSLLASPLVATVAPGQATAFTITPAQLGVTVTYLTSGVPAGTRVDLTPNPSFGAVTMTLTTSASTLAGLYPITVTGVTPTEAKSVVVVLEVQATGGLTASPTASAVAAGGSATFAISVDPAVVSAANPLTFGLSGLPAGASALFSPGTSASGTTLIVTTAASTAPGTYPLVITGTAAGVSRAVTVALAVSGPGSTPSFAVAVIPSALAVTRGASVTYNFTIIAQGGFSGPVTITVTDLPAGASSVAIPDASTAAIVTGRLIITTSATTPVGVFTFRVTGTGSGLTATVSAILNVV